MLLPFCPGNTTLTYLAPRIEFSRLAVPIVVVVELTVALHSVFNTPQDKIIWDVGHQCYVHKILTPQMLKSCKMCVCVCGFVCMHVFVYLHVYFSNLGRKVVS